MAGQVESLIDAIVHQDYMCTVCQENVQDGTEAPLPCATSHRTHGHCLVTWFHRQASDGVSLSCPVCRSVFIQAVLEQEHARQPFDALFAGRELERAVVSEAQRATEAYLVKNLKLGWAILLLFICSVIIFCICIVVIINLSFTIQIRNNVLK